MVRTHNRKRQFAGSGTARAAGMILAFVAWLSSAPLASAAPGTLLWEDQFDQAQRADIAVAVAASRGIVVAVGTTRDAAGNREILVRAYDGSTGVVHWQDKVGFAGGLASVSSVVIADNVVVVGGSGTNAAGDFDWLVRAYDLRAERWRGRIASTLPAATIKSSTSQLTGAVCLRQELAETAVPSRSPIVT